MVTMKSSNPLTNIQPIRGFTLLEVVLILVLLGIVSLLAANAINQNLEFKANAEELDFLANEMIKVTKEIYTEVGGINNIRFNDVTRDNNDLLDVLFHGSTFLKENFLAPYFNSAAYPLKERILTIVLPAASISTGDYRLKFNADSRIRIISDRQFSESNTLLEFTNINPRIVERIKDYYEAGDELVDTDGFIQHDNIQSSNVTLRYSFDID